MESSTRIASGLLTSEVAAGGPRRLGFKDFSKFVEHLDVLFDIEELILVEIVGLDDDAPAIAVSLIVDEVRIILDVAVKFENLAGEWRIDQDAVVDGADGDEQVAQSDFVTSQWRRY